MICVLMNVEQDCPLSLQKESRQDVAVCLLLAIYREITSVNALAVDRQIPTRVHVM